MTGTPLQGPNLFTQQRMLSYLTATCPPNVDLPYIVRTYYMASWGQGHQVRPDLLLLQAQKETAGFSSFIYRQAHNFAGIGALPNSIVKNINGVSPAPLQGTSWNYDQMHNEWVPACQYKNLLWGVLGHFYHMLIYVDYVSAIQYAGVGEEFDPRFALTLSVRNKMPQAVTLLDLSHTWATGGTYGEDLEKKVTEVMAFKA